jgi:UDP-2,3-diacylglucosamine pyrophosphatase LpxH
MGPRAFQHFCPMHDVITTTAEEIADILLHCEESGSAEPYDYDDQATQCSDLNKSPGPIVAVSSAGADIFIVSDLHIAAGRRADGRYEGSENFFYDESFQRFLNHARQASQSTNQILIINGDFIDFLRVMDVPGRPERLTRVQKKLTQLKIRSRKSKIPAMKTEPHLVKDFIDWQQALAKIGIERSIDELIHSITDKEELYGLKTDRFKSVYRIDIVVKGHLKFFEALAGWIDAGNRLIIVKGNHDLEWYWRDVRNYLRLALAEMLARQTQTDVRPALLKVLPKLSFYDHAMLIDEDFYVEHGHFYERMTRVVGDTTVPGGKELNIPFGSFFNRYLIDFVELQYPFIDNVRPTKSVLPLMLRNRFFTGLRLLYDHLSVLAKTIPRGYVRYIFGQHIIRRVVVILLIVIVPLALFVWHTIVGREGWLLQAVELVALLAVIYAAIQGVAQLQLSEPDSLAEFAHLRFAENPNYRLMTFGHTHSADQFEDRGHWFYNTGTWIPIVEFSAADIRENRCFTFLHFVHDGTGKLQPTAVQRWDDEAARGENLVLIKREGQ